jgi:type IV pilus assembly protein PilM
MKKNIFKKMFKTGNNTYLSCDFGGSRIRLVQASRNGKNFEVAGWSQKRIPKGIVEKGKITKIEDFIEIFKEALNDVQGEFFGNNIAITVPEEKIFTRVLEVSLEDQEKKIDELVKWETEASMPIAISEIYYDWRIIKKNKNKVKVLVMATEKLIVDNYLEVFDRLGLTVLAIEPESLSMARSLIKFNSEGYTLLVDIGDHSSNLIICRNGLPVFTSSSHLSGKMLTDLVVRKFGYSFEKAERYKIKIGLTRIAPGSQKSKSIFDSFVISLVGEIEKMLDFLNYNLFPEDDKKEIEKIILCGGGSNLKGLSSYLTVKLRKTVTQSNPWINFNFENKIPPISKQNSQSFAPVIGLTLKFEENEKNY